MRWSGTRLRRSPWIVSYWKDGQLIYENYLTRVRISAAPVLTQVLNYFDRWRRPEEVASELKEFLPESIQRGVTSLVKHSFLEEEGCTEPRSKAMDAWRDWSPEAAFFHFATKDVRYRIAPVEERVILQQIRQNPQPAFFKKYPRAPAVRLSRKSPTRRSEFERVLLERRTWREFSSRKLSKEKLGRLLGLTWRVIRYVRLKYLGPLPFKTSPSAGARHPIEVYVIPLRVEGLPQGIYHYAADRHRLECLHRGPMKRRVVRYLGGQWWFEGAAVVFLMTAVFRREMWRYNYPRAYRSVLLDAGHLCQTFCLAATWLGLAPFSTAALADSLIEKDIGIDGITESALYAAGVGERP